MVKRDQTWAEACADTIHLKQAVSLYLFALPFTLIKELGWGMIPIVTVVAVSLLSTSRWGWY
jgi:predicted membrane chloride channel (bestrophin family)